MGKPEVLGPFVPIATTAANSAPNLHYRSWGSLTYQDKARPVPAACNITHLWDQYQRDRHRAGVMCGFIKFLRGHASEVLLWNNYWRSSSSQGVSLYFPFSIDMAWWWGSGGGGVSTFISLFIINEALGLHSALKSAGLRTHQGLFFSGSAGFSSPMSDSSFASGCQARKDCSCLSMPCYLSF